MADHSNYKIRITNQPDSSEYLAEKSLAKCLGYAIFNDGTFESITVARCNKKYRVLLGLLKKRKIYRGIVLDFNDILNLIYNDIYFWVTC